ncbi:hypothetical protein M3Y95_01271700 [Aphelenchoides besseyi]|nr:hypothetical protein M3Y95_01271700 [Aphelenchoides besseyi]
MEPRPIEQLCSFNNSSPADDYYALKKAQFVHHQKHAVYLRSIERKQQQQQYHERRHYYSVEGREERLLAKKAKSSKQVKANDSHHVVTPMVQMYPPVYSPSIQQSTIYPPPSNYSYPPPSNLPMYSNTGYFTYTNW